MTETMTEKPFRDQRRVPGWGIFSGALLLGACAGGDSGSTDYVELTVSSDDIHTVATPDMVTRVVDLQPAGDGRVWLLNSQAPYFVVLGPDGQVEREFGERGGGPQEFGAPVALVLGPGSEDVWTYDVRRNALIRISAGEGRELALPTDSVPPSSLITFQGAGINQGAPWLESTGDGFLLAPARGSQLETALQLWNADIVLVREDGPEVGLQRHTPIADLLGDPASRYGNAAALLPYPVWTVCGNRTVGLYDPLSNTLRRITESGEELVAFALPEERQVEITVDRVFEMFYRQVAANVSSAQLPPKAEMRSLTEEQNEELVSTSADVFPEYADLRCTSDGTLWIRPFDMTAVRLGQGSDWIRLSADGSQTRFALPRAFRTFGIESDRIWGTLQDTLGVESIVWVGLDSLRS